MVQKVALLTAGGFAPCLSTAIGALIGRYSELAPDVEIIAYKNGYQGLLEGEFYEVTPEVRANAHLLKDFGGSPIGNSRVKLTNVDDLVKRGLVPEHVDPLKTAADRLVSDGVDVLHTIGGDDTNTTAADLAAYLRTHDYHLTVVGLPKTIDNDVVPIQHSLGADTAAEQGAAFAKNVLAEHNASARTLIVHEVMGRNCGWLTAATAAKYHDWVKEQTWVPGIGLDSAQWDVHGVYVPEAVIDLQAEANRLRHVMDRVGCVNVFLSEGAGVDAIVAEMQARGEDVPRDAFGHIRLDKVNPGAWFGKQFAKMIDAEKTLVQKSGYFARSAPSNDFDLKLINEMCDLAVDSAFAGVSGVIGHDEEAGGELRPIEFDRIKGGKPFDILRPWFIQLLAEIGQAAPRPTQPTAAH